MRSNISSAFPYCSIDSPNELISEEATLIVSSASISLPAVLLSPTFNFLYKPKFTSLSFSIYILNSYRVIGLIRYGPLFRALTIISSHRLRPSYLPCYS